MNSETIQLTSLIVHLVEFIETGERADLEAAKGIMQTPEVAEMLKPNALLPLTRSEKSVAEILESL